MRRILLLVPMLIGIVAAKSPLPDRGLVILLANTEAVPAHALRQAEQSAAAILARAGVWVEWVDCAMQDCAFIPGFWMQFADRRPSGLHSDTAGYAVRYWVAGGTSGYAVVAWRPVEAAAAGHIEAGILLGATMAHEIGHLLLGRDTHSLNGVMVPRFRRREIEMAARGELGFTDDQVNRIRAALGH